MMVRSLRSTTSGRCVAGQSDIKKLRRENELLRREIWSLRDECDRLEELLKRKQEEEEDEQDEDEEESTDEDGEGGEGRGEDSVEDGGGGEKRKRQTREGGVLSNLVDTLSVVQEETEDTASREPTPTMLNDTGERRCELYEGTMPPLMRVHCVHPFTAATTINPQQLPALTVTEVIECCWKQCGGAGGSNVEGVRLLGGSLFLSFKDRTSLESQISIGLKIRGIKLDLEDVSQGTLVLAMSGVPHSLDQATLAKVLSQFGPIIGHIERRLYRNVDTGERLARVRLTSSLPKRIYVDGHEIAIRSLPHEELTRLATLPSRIIPSSTPTLQVSVKPETSNEKNTSSGSSHSSLATPGSITTPGSIATPWSPSPLSRSTTPFIFPTPQPTTAPKEGAEGGSCSPVVGRQGAESETSGSTRRSRQRTRRGHSPSSSSEQESPNKPSRRKISVRRRDTIVEDSILGLDRERSNSLSSRCSAERRKLSFTGRESGKLPWFACWGNGCI